MDALLRANEDLQSMCKELMNVVREARERQKAVEEELSQLQERQAQYHKAQAAVCAYATLKGDGAAARRNLIGFARDAQNGASDLRQWAESGFILNSTQPLHLTRDVTEIWDQKNGTNLLHEAAAFDNAPVIELLLTEPHFGPVPVDLPDLAGRQAIHLAAQALQCAALRALLRAGADPEAQDPSGQTPLDLIRAKFPRGDPDAVPDESAGDGDSWTSGRQRSAEQCFKLVWEANERKQHGERPPWVPQDDNEGEGEDEEENENEERSRARRQTPQKSVRFSYAHPAPDEPEPTDVLRRSNLVESRLPTPMGPRRQARESPLSPTVPATVRAHVQCLEAVAATIQEDDVKHRFERHLSLLRDELSRRADDSSAPVVLPKGALPSWANDSFEVSFGGMPSVPQALFDAGTRCSVSFREAMDAATAQLSGDDKGAWAEGIRAMSCAVGMPRESPHRHAYQFVLLLVDKAPVIPVRGTTTADRKPPRITVHRVEAMDESWIQPYGQTIAIKNVVDPAGGFEVAAAIGPATRSVCQRVRREWQKALSRGMGTLACAALCDERPDDEDDDGDEEGELMVDPSALRCPQKAGESACEFHAIQAGRSIARDRHMGVPPKAFMILSSRFKKTAQGVRWALARQPPVIAAPVRNTSTPTSSTPRSTGSTRRRQALQLVSPSPSQTKRRRSSSSNGRNVDTRVPTPYPRDFPEDSGHPSGVVVDSPPVARALATALDAESETKEAMQPQDFATGQADEEKDDPTAANFFPATSPPAGAPDSDMAQWFPDDTDSGWNW